MSREFTLPREGTRVVRAGRGAISASLSSRGCRSHVRFYPLRPLSRRRQPRACSRVQARVRLRLTVKRLSVLETMNIDTLRYCPRYPTFFTLPREGTRVVRAGRGALS